MRLDSAPKRLLRQVLEGPSLPFAVSTFPNALINVASSIRLRHRDHLRRLPGSLQRGCNDRLEGHSSQPGSDGLCLLLTNVVQQDTGPPPRKDTAGICRGAPMANKEQHRHCTRLTEACLLLLQRSGGQHSGAEQNDQHTASDHAIDHEG